MSEMRDLPEWVWGLVDVIHEWDETHPILYRLSATSEVQYVPAECPCGRLSRAIPREVRETAEVIRSRGLKAVGTDVQSDES